MTQNKRVRKSSTSKTSSGELDWNAITDALYSGRSAKELTTEGANFRIVSFCKILIDLIKKYDLIGKSDKVKESKIKKEYPNFKDSSVKTYLRTMNRIEKQVSASSNKKTDGIYSKKGKWDFIIDSLLSGTNPTDLINKGADFRVVSYCRKIIEIIMKYDLIGADDKVKMSSIRKEYPNFTEKSVKTYHNTIKLIEKRFYANDEKKLVNITPPIETSPNSQLSKNTDFQICQNIIDEFSKKQKLHETLRKQIIKISPEDMENFVAEIFRKHGDENTIVTKRSNDRGVDVRTKLEVDGLFYIYLAIQVKHRKDKISSKVVREIRGSIKAGERGMIVSTSGFTRDAIKEANDLTMGIVHLVDLDKLINFIIKDFEN